MRIVKMYDWTFEVDFGGFYRLVGRTEGHTSPHVTEGKMVRTSRVVGMEGDYVVTETGTRYDLEESDERGQE